MREEAVSVLLAWAESAEVLTLVKVTISVLGGDCSCGEREAATTSDSGSAGQLSSQRSRRKTRDEAVP